MHPASRGWVCFPRSLTDGLGAESSLRGSRSRPHTSPGPLICLTPNWCAPGLPRRAWGSRSVCVLVPQSCPTLCDPTNCNPPGSSVHGVLQARILKWIAFPSPEDLPNPGIEPWLESLQIDGVHQGHDLQLCSPMLPRGSACDRCPNAHGPNSPPAPHIPRPLAHTCSWMMLTGQWRFDWSHDCVLKDVQFWKSENEPGGKQRLLKVS